MPNAYIQARPVGAGEGTPVEDYVVESDIDTVLSTHQTQAEAIAWAKCRGYHPLVARVRHLNRKRMADHWCYPR